MSFSVLSALSVVGSVVCFVEMSFQNISSSQRARSIRQRFTQCPRSV